MKIKLESTLKRTEGQPEASPWHTRKVAVPVVGVIVVTAVILGLATSTVILLTSTSRAPIAGPQAPPSAAFLTTDTTTQGDWKEKYGSAGFALADDGQDIPGYASIVLPSKSRTEPSGTSTWGDSVANVRGLQRIKGASRVAGHWYGYYSFNIDVNLKDEKTHRVSLYLVDWDSTARVENVEILSAISQKVLDVRQVSNFNGGQYLVWNMTGHVTVRVTKVAGANAAASGLFFD